jgi:hypothetical protein
MPHEVYVPHIEAVPSASEFYGNTRNIWDNYRAMIVVIWRRTLASPWLHNMINELWWVFIKYHIVFHVLNVPAEIIPILTHDSGPTVQAMNNSYFQVQWILI